MIDKALVLRKTAELEEYLKQMEEFTNINSEEYSADWKAQRIIERTLQMLIETCVDIANHIISDQGFRIPKSYGDTFKVLGENDILSKGFIEEMVKMTKFRNIVVHQYDRVDAEIVVGILKNNLQDFSVYKDAILTFLKSSRSP